MKSSALMDKRRIGEYVWLGTNIRYLLDLSSGVPLGGDGSVCFNLDALPKRLESAGLRVTRRLTRELGGGELLAELRSQVVKDAEATLTEDDCEKLRVMMRTVRATAMAESNGLFAYVVSEKRLEISKLIDDPGALFSPGIYASLPAQARLDMAEACKCIAFERPTAAAFHLMRAIEECLREYYLATVKRKRLKVLLWKAMTDQLASRHAPPPAVLLAQLDNIRANFRNPTQHPDAVYDIHEAQDLAFLTFDAIARLTRAMPASNSDAS